MLSSLPMYPFAPATLAAYWQWLRHTLQADGVADLPAQLQVPQDYLAHWQTPDLLLSQACGYPVATILREKVQVLGAFHYNAPGCHDWQYSSLLMVRADDPRSSLAEYRGATAVCNERHSQSGYHALRSAVAPLAHDGVFFGRMVFSGAHHASSRLVASGAADIAALDCVSAHLLAEQDKETFSQLRCIGHTDPMPGLPLITSIHTPPAQVAKLRQALQASLQAPALQHLRESMLISGFSPLSNQDYDICRHKAELNRQHLPEWH